MRHTVWLPAIVVVLTFTPVVISEDFAPARIDDAKIRPPKEGRVNEPYWGIVTEVTKTSIMIQHEKDDPMKFAVSETLAAGKVPKEPRPVPGSNYKYLVPASSMYRLMDVKVGDRVTVTYAHLGGVSICDHITIHKRPGGRIPPLPDEAEAIRRGPQHPGVPPRKHIKYHEYWNAYWDLEDKGIPFPEEFGAMRRWPVAPMPREVKQPKSSDAKP